MSHSGASVGAMSHKRDRYESEWSKCGKKKKRVRVNRNRLKSLQGCTGYNSSASSRSLGRGIANPE